MVMKDYLSTTERLNIIAALKVAEMTEQFVQVIYLLQRKKET